MRLCLSRGELVVAVHKTRAWLMHMYARTTKLARRCTSHHVGDHKVQMAAKVRAGGPMKGDDKKHLATICAMGCPMLGARLLRSAERSFLLSLEPPSRRPSPHSPRAWSVSPRLHFAPIHSTPQRHTRISPKNNRVAMLPALTASQIHTLPPPVSLRMNCVSLVDY